ncbi:MAG: type II toxin-antitoxin system RelE/ParE family toxin [Alphaproteobacteria bacterium]|nr:type II toxin-antitoxin system RelE/ParE family toxin [Alphaproteobacteria bacterium]
MRVVFSDKAKADLRDIALFIARDSKVRALSFVRELRAKALDLGKMPGAFALVPRFERRGIRRRVYRRYLILYRVEESRVVVLRILHGARDYEQLLFPERWRVPLPHRNCLSDRQWPDLAAADPRRN